MKKTVLPVTSMLQLRVLLPDQVRISLVRDSGAWLCSDGWSVRTFNELPEQRKDRFEIRVTNGSRVVAAILWHRGLKPGAIESLGTWVSPKYRGLGIAARIWEEMLIQSGASRVKSCIISNEGALLIEKVHKLHQDIRWRIYDDRTEGDRELRPELLRKLAV